ncbi:MAG: hypothetical protein C4538_10890 [Nitrospiraceae bacterium]|nr:MAG: hypothetical protein C4538_10890 [Nitrospiraceae bacterium]
MGTILIIFAYLCYAIFLWRIVWRIVLLLKLSGHTEHGALQPRKASLLEILKTGRDIIFFTRLLRSNPLLWIGEWVFHMSFILVLVRHLRYVLDTAPHWLMNLQFAGMLAGYVLPVALVYVVAIKLWVEKTRYFSSGNFFLLSLLFLLSVTGLIMKNFIHPDIISIKNFISNALAFRFATAPESYLFVVHFIAAFVFLAYLPTHIFAAPFTLLEARKREEEHGGIMHER